MHPVTNHREDGNVRRSRPAGGEQWLNAAASPSTRGLPDSLALTQLTCRHMAELATKETAYGCWREMTTSYALREGDAIDGTVTGTAAGTAAGTVTSTPVP